VLATASRRDIVIKAADGAAGRGSRVLFSHEGVPPSAPPFAGPYLIEDRILQDGMDRKLYVAGSRCFGLLKPWPRKQDDAGTAFRPSADLGALARSAGRAMGLEIYGVDFVFPGLRGVAGAVDAVVDHVRLRAAEIAEGR
jgi:hypothetical protein